MEIKLLKRIIRYYKRRRAGRKADKIMDELLEMAQEEFIPTDLERKADDEFIKDLES